MRACHSAVRSFCRALKNRFALFYFAPFIRLLACGQVNRGAPAHAVGLPSPRFRPPARACRLAPSFGKGKQAPFGALAYRSAFRPLRGLRLRLVGSAPRFRSVQITVAGRSASAPPRLAPRGSPLGKPFSASAPRQGGSRSFGASPLVARAGAFLAPLPSRVSLLL